MMLIDKKKEPIKKRLVFSNWFWQIWQIKIAIESELNMQSGSKVVLNKKK